MPTCTNTEGVKPEYTYTKSLYNNFINTITINNCTFELALAPTNNPYIPFHKLKPYFGDFHNTWNWRHEENIDKLVEAIILARLNGDI